MKTNNNDKYAALRLLGAALHTLEDFLAHSESSLIGGLYSNKMVLTSLLQVTGVS
jgi:uncharacterized protein (DUF2267 family)